LILRFDSLTSDLECVTASATIYNSKSEMQVQLMTTYLMKGEYQGATEVPDPFHGGPQEFDKV